jgi:hypothetical protein
MTDSKKPEDADPRSDIQQAVEARSDALKRGEGGTEADMGRDGEVKNQNDDAQ